MMPFSISPAALSWSEWLKRSLRQAKSELRQLRRCELGNIVYLYRATGAERLTIMASLVAAIVLLYLALTLCGSGSFNREGSLSRHQTLASPLTRLIGSFGSLSFCLNFFLDTCSVNVSAESERPTHEHAEHLKPRPLLPMLHPGDRSI